MTLKDLQIGENAKITAVGGEGALRQHFLDMGVVPGAEIKLMKLAPMGDPMEFRIHGYELTLRLADAEKIEAEPMKQEEKVCPKPAEEAGENGAEQAEAGRRNRQKESRTVAKAHHPGLGEGGIYHVKTDGDPLPDGTILTFALAGNQNCGKTTLFNQLT